MNDFELKFDPKTIEHLGVKMYSTLPPALAELISNAYDADASKVKITFHEKKGTPVSIVVEDNGHGMDANAIQNKFLVIGRNRRTDDGDKPSLIFNRLPTGKKGLGKLALFGLSKEITVKTIRDNKENAFVLNWDRLLSSEGIYNPEAKITDRPTDKSSGTSIKLSCLKRKTPFDIDGLADSLSRMFIVDDTFNIELHDISKNRVVMVSNSRRYSSIIEQFKWGTKNVQEWFPDNDFLTSKNVKFDLLTAKTPLSPSSGLRGISIFSRGKLVNAPEFFSNSTSSHFFEYLTGH
ncbi:ATP-binding protein, partial [Aeromonas veronii]